MPPRAISSGSLSFGLVNVPVKLFSTGRAEERVSFHWLHAACGHRVKQQYFCPKDEQVVERSELVRGYEVGKGKYVPVEQEELAEVKAKPRESIDVVEFVPVGAVDPIYYDHAYYLGPDKGGSKGYAVLVEAMKRAERVAVAQWAARGGEHVVTVRADGNVLVMQQLRYASEVRPTSEIPVEKQHVSERELDLAEKLIAQTAREEFDPEAFTDEVKARTKKLLAKKAAAGQVEEEEAAEAGAGGAGAGGKVIDLMEALKASLGGGGGKGGAKAAKSGRKPARAAAGGRRRATRGGGGGGARRGSRAAGAAGGTRKRRTTRS
jgi:DNA end-binding protein Ku